MRPRVTPRDPRGVLIAYVGLELEGLAYGLMQQTHDFHEGVEAFVEKRKPEFDGT